MEVDDEEMEQPTSSSKGEKKRFEVKKVRFGESFAEAVHFCLNSEGNRVVCIYDAWNLKFSTRQDQNKGV